MLLALRTTLLLQLSIAKRISCNPKFWIILSVDIVFIILSLYCAYSLRFEGNLFALEQFSQFLGILPIMVCVKIPTFYFWGLYRGMWRYTSTEDLFNILKATFIATIILVAILLFINRFSGLSRSVFILDTIFTFLLICGHRVGIRFLFNTSYNTKDLLGEREPRAKKRLLLVGAGDAAEKILRELKTNHSLPYTPIALLDDDPQKTGLKIHGVPVVGLVEDLKEHALFTKAEEILISIASTNGKEMKRLVELCQGTKIPFKVIPVYGEILNGNISVRSIRDLSYNDLLGREEVDLEQDKIGDYLAGKTVLITGAGGSIGSELCRQILRFSPEQLVLFDSSEENLYNIQMELLHEKHITNAITILGKVQDLRLLNLVFCQYRPTVVFHAAAYKHVPLIERNPWQAVNNNIFATQLLIETSIVYRVERFVLVSTDKAVRPTNVMGASKRITELLMQAYDSKNWDGTFSSTWQEMGKDVESFPDLIRSAPNHDTRFMAVRFGNVIGSSGSVIPLFKRQIEHGGPVTVTHPEITRYFMSIDEAAQLILQTGAMGNGGEIFILKMGAPVKIDNMARDLIRLAGKEPDTEIEIKYTGLREGEKLYEELITVGEGIVDTHHKKIMVLQGNCFIACTELHNYLEDLANESRAHDSLGIKQLLKHIIPEYIPDISFEKSVGYFEPS
ncbi:nucleoside-diphosphate sugar epimerase/dehydratase [Desulforhopalus sp. IMCC35007]|uniref:polysaccharide biosynthesis protein n=1 Tax=Desulforhopalus sp. IMCC35007 TaxID=2569543 RepID=UPI0010AEBCB8|nr:nucleoside-diphosphate sugar epimerase/dehydratase [Desulforhopalus sp. IMCC35007]TKB09912.1 polysaccharide biosynthesis protein [Desulforhopalus sp. IMCC35007]